MLFYVVVSRVELAYYAAQSKAINSGFIALPISALDNLPNGTMFLLIVLSNS